MQNGILAPPRALAICVNGKWNTSGKRKLPPGGNNSRTCPAISAKWQQPALHLCAAC